MRVKSFLTVVGLTGMLAACTNPNGVPSMSNCNDPGLFTSSNVGTVIGAVGGGYAGAAIGKKANTTNTVVGALLGGAIGNSIGSNGDQLRRQRCIEAMQAQRQLQPPGFGQQYGVIQGGPQQYQPQYGQQQYQPQGYAPQYQQQGQQGTIIFRPDPVLVQPPERIIGRR